MQVATKCWLGICVITIHQPTNFRFISSLACASHSMITSKANSASSQANSTFYPQWDGK